MEGHNRWRQGSFLHDGKIQVGFAVLAWMRSGFWWQLGLSALMLGWLLLADRGG
jgi:hypothetical protein